MSRRKILIARAIDPQVVAFLQHSIAKASSLKVTVAEALPRKSLPDVWLWPSPNDATHAVQLQQPPVKARDMNLWPPRPCKKSSNEQLAKLHKKSNQKTHPRT
jgi:hypothetical protein